jgi:hypothetical protein
MALNFDSGAYYALNKDKRAAETQKAYAPLNSANELAQTVGGIGQDMQAMQERKKQEQMQQLLLQLKQQEAGQGQQRLGMEQQKAAYEYGQPIDPNQQDVGPQPQPILGKSSFMPGGQGQVASPSPLIDRFKQWQAQGMPKKSAEGDFMPALGASERKDYFEAQNPKPPQMMMSPYQQGSLDIKNKELGLKQQELTTKQQGEISKTQQDQTAQAEKAQNVSRQIDQALGMVGSTTAGFGGKILGHVAGTKATDFQGVLDAIKANLGFDQLMAMKTMSKNGASGLGALSDNEMKLLTSLGGSLDRNQSPEQLRSNLLALKEKYANFNNALGFSQGSTPHPQDSQAVQWAKQNPNDLRAQKILQLNGAQ